MIWITYKVYHYIICLSNENTAIGVTVFPERIVIMKKLNTSISIRNLVIKVYHIPFIIASKNVTYYCLW